MERYLKLIEDELFGLFQSDNNIKSALNEFLRSPSKRIRSKLAILYILSKGANILGKTIDLLCAGEIIHNASLLHDDVLDNSELRRGKATIGKIFSPKISILAGDYLLSLAVEKIISVSDNKVLEAFLACTKKMCEAEMLQFLLKGKKPSIDEYIEICTGKTASLFSTILKSSAILCGLDTDEAETFGENFGILFQLKNDIEPFSSETDKKNKIKTAVDIIGIEKTNILIDNYKEEILEQIKKFPKNEYSKQLGDLVRTL